jgi:hypothetical protein
MPVIVMAWFVGATGCSLRLLMGFLSVAALRRSPQAPVLAEWQQTLDRLVKRMHVSRRVRLLPTDRVESPAVIGWLRPVILAPVGALSGLSREQVEALLAHELAHVRRHDYLVNVLQGIAESLLFYHPAVWWISSQIRTEREHCCDDLAVETSGDVLVYARALAALESMRPAHVKAALSANGGSLVRRIQRLIDPVAAHRPAGWGVAWSVGALLLGMTGVAVAGAQAQNPVVVPIDSVWIDTVTQGDMKLQVRAAGTVTSAHTAALKVAEKHVQDVRQGMPVAIAFEHRKEIVAGKVAAMHPEVTNGTAIADIAIADALPPGVKVQDPVDGVIAAGALTNVVHMARPVHGQSNSRLTLFKLEPDGHTAKKVPVQFGAASVNAIEVKSGLHAGDKVIVSDMSKYERVVAIVLR